MKNKNIIKLPEEILNKIRSGIVHNGHVKVTGLGIFETRTIAGHPGRNPSTGEIMDFPDHVRIKFRPTSSLYKEVQK